MGMRPKLPLRRASHLCVHSPKPMPASYGGREQSPGTPAPHPLIPDQAVRTWIRQGNQPAEAYVQTQQEGGQVPIRSPKVDGGIHPHMHCPVAQAMLQVPEANSNPSPTGPAGQRKHDTTVEGTTEYVL